MDTRSKINTGLFDECCLEFSDEKDKKHPNFHFLINYLKKNAENEMVEHDFLLQNWAIIVFGILAFLSHNKFSHWIKKEHFNSILLIYLTCDFVVPENCTLLFWFSQSYFFLNDQVFWEESFASHI